MGLEDMIAKARSGVTGALGRHRATIDQGIDKIGDAANTKTGGRHEARIRKSTDRARARLTKNDPDHRDDHDGPDPDGPVPARPGPR